MNQLPQIAWIWQLDEYTRTLPQFTDQQRFQEAAKQLVEESNDPLFLGLFYVTSPWCDAETRDRCRSIINRMEITQDQWDSIEKMITADLKLLKNSKLTKAGYKNINRSYERVSNDRDAWKEHHIGSIPLFALWLSHLDTRGVRNHWGLIAPTVLNVLDDHEAQVKLKGVELLSMLLDIAEADFLHSTGLFTMFYDAVRPLLTYLPTMTPAEVSKRIMAETYPVLFKLFNGDKDCLMELLLETMSSLDHVREHYGVMSVLIQRITEMVKLLGDHTTKVLPRLIYTIGMIIANPWSEPLHSDLLDCLIQVELNCWMRLETHKYDILAMCKMVGSPQSEVCLSLLKHCVSVDDCEIAAAR